MQHMATHWFLFYLVCCFATCFCLLPIGNVPQQSRCAGLSLWHSLRFPWLQVMYRKLWMRVIFWSVNQLEWGFKSSRANVCLMNYIHVAIYSQTLLWTNQFSNAMGIFLHFVHRISHVFFHNKLKIPQFFLLLWFDIQVKLSFVWEHLTRSYWMFLHTWSPSKWLYIL